MNRSLILGLMASILLTGVVLAGRRQHETRRFETQGAQRLEVELDFGAGELRIIPQEMADVAALDIWYDERSVKYDIEYAVKGKTGILYVESTNRRHRDIDTDDNELELTLSTKYPVTLDIDVGACNADIDLGGLSLEELSIDIGAASGKIDFSKPNPVRLRQISVDAGAASLDMYSIGNANFEDFSFEGGAGSFDLDFRGKYTGESRIDIEVGLSSTDIMLPADVPVRVESDDDNWLSSVDFHNDDLDEVEDGVYETSDFKNAQVRIILNVDVGLGSVDIYFK
ncbi:MAG: toast rack family protein [Candidatus Zixiibacteriota bacterium]